MKALISPFALSRLKLLLALEFAVVFIGAPFLIVAIKNRLLMIGLLWAGAFVAHHFTRNLPRLKTDVSHLGEHLKPIALRFVVLAPIIALLTWLTLPEAFLSLPRAQPLWWLAIMILYPLLSVWPQEMVYRAFLYHRYAPLFGKKWGYVAASAFAFGYAHMIFLNWIAIAMTAFGGFLFARDYARHRSLALVCLEHALYGCLIFTVGLGRFFYSGAAWH
jgi:CAAX protease family protein